MCLNEEGGGRMWKEREGRRGVGDLLEGSDAQIFLHLVKGVSFLRILWM